MEPENPSKGGRVRAKKTKGRPASIKYMLSLDRTLRRVSLRKIVERVTAKQRTTPRAASKAAKPGTKRNGAANRRTSLDRRALVFGTVCVVAAAALIAARQPASEGRAAQSDDSGQIERIEAAISSAAVPEPTPQPTMKKVAAPALAEPAPVTSVPAVARPTPVAKPAEAAAPSATSATNLPTAAPVASDDQPEGKIVTLAGCLERNDESFLLKNTSGDAAPKSRSWKSGFLRKRSSSVELLDETPRFRLASYVGRRVETTGVLVDREMRVRSFRVHGSCD